MSPRRIIEGHLWLRVEEVAECYSVEVEWVHEAWVLGLVEGRAEGGAELIAARELDRLAQLVRLSRILGLDLAAAAGVL